MSFAHPDALLGLLLVPLLLIFYMWRAQHQRRVVSSTWLWQEALARFTHHPTRRLPLREPLLLLQILATLVLTALLAGPALVRPARVHRIVVLDGSAAMAATDVGPSRYVAAIRRARALLDGRGDDQTISLIAYAADERHPGRRPDAERAIEGAGMWNPKQPFQYDPLLVVSRSRADLTLTVLRPQKQKHR